MLESDSIKEFKLQDSGLDGVSRAENDDMEALDHDDLAADKVDLENSASPIRVKTMLKTTS